MPTMPASQGWPRERCCLRSPNHAPGTNPTRRLKIGIARTTDSITGLAGFRTALRLEDPLGGGRELRELRCGAPRTAEQLASAVRARTLESHARAIPAERAFEGADVRVLGLGRKVAVTALAVG